MTHTLRRDDPNHGPRIIIVEDEALIALATAQLLTRAGYVVVGIAASGAEALAQYEESADRGNRPDAALMDIRLRGTMDGLDTAIRLRERDPALAIIFLSASLDHMRSKRAEQARADAVLTKPIGDRALLSTLESSIGARQMAMGHA